MNGNIYGGYFSKIAGYISGNQVTISGGEVGGNIYGGYNNVSGNVSGNSVIISGGQIRSSVIHGGFSFNSDATDNRVIIYGNPIFQNPTTIFGGVSRNGNAADNSVIISGNQNLPNVYFVGGQASNFTGNTLNTVRYTGTMQDFDGFENVKFFMSNPLPSSPIITTIDPYGLNDLILTNVNIDITGIDSGDALAVDETITLISSNVGINSNNTTVGKGTDTLTVGSPVTVETSGGGTWTFTLTDKAITATLVTPPSTEEYFIAATDVTDLRQTLILAGENLVLPEEGTPNTATNKTITWSVANPGATGADIDGYTLSAVEAGTMVVRATVKDGHAPGWDYTEDFTITVEAFAFADNALPQGSVGNTYSQTLADTNLPITCEITSGALPDGLTLSAEGEISGSPTTAGTSTFTVTGTNSAGRKTKEFSVEILPQPTTSPTPTNPPVFTTSPIFPTSPVTTTSPTTTSPATTSPEPSDPIVGPTDPTIPTATTGPTEPTSTTAPTSSATPTAPATFPTGRGDVSANTGISADNLEEKDGKVYVNDELAEEIANDLLGLDGVNTESLPVFAVTVPSGSQPGSNIEVKLGVKGADMLAFFPDEVKLIGMTSANTGRLLQYAHERTGLTDGQFVILYNGAVYDGEIDPNANYDLIVVIRDGGLFDLDKTPGEVTASLFFASDKSGSGGGSGCDAVVANYGSLLFAVALIIPFIPRKKK